MTKKEPAINLGDLNDADLAELERKARMEKLKRTLDKLKPLRNEYAELMNKISKDVEFIGLTAVDFLQMDDRDLDAHAANYIASFGASGGPILRGRELVKNKAPIKYRHPKNPELKWTGRGKRPHWVRQYEEQGGSITDCLVSRESNENA